MSKQQAQIPNPQATSAAQTGSNVTTANANTYAANGNVTTPDGTRTTTFRTQDVTDPYTGVTNKAVIPDVTTTLSPAQQAIKTQQDATKLGLGTLANNQTQFLQGYMSKPFTFDDTAHQNWANDLYGKLNDKNNALAMEQAQSRLSNMGIKMGTPAYDNEISRLEQSQQYSKNQFDLNSQQQDFQQQQALRNQPINEITALAGGAQVAQPSFQGANVAQIAPTDNTNIINNAYQANQNQANANNAGWGSVLSGLAGGAVALSDRRAKKDIHKVGEMNGQNVYKYKMKSGGGIRLGLIAQDVQKKTPEAVVTGNDGLKRVNYGIALGRKAA